MAYPQQPASQEIIEGQNFYRLFTPLQTGGDVYEMDVAATGFALGPQSDIARVKITYFDPSQPNEIASFLLTQKAPFFGKLNALVSSKYAVSNTNARILISSADIWNPNWFPTTANSPAALLAQTMNYIRPRIDLVAYTGNAPVLSYDRADRVEKGRLHINVGEDIYSVIVPFYGRRYAEFRVRQASAGGEVAGLLYNAIGVNFHTDGPSQTGTTPVGIAFATEITAPAAISATADVTTSFFVRASTSGLFDYLCFQIKAADLLGISGSAFNSVRYMVRTSDQER